MVEAIGKENISEVQEFLSSYEDTAQFLINNLRLHGPELTDHHNSGNFKLIRKNGDIVAVFCLTARGNLLIQSQVPEPDLILKACFQEPMPLKGFIGPSEAVLPVYQEFSRRTPKYTPKLESIDFLYTYELSPSNTKVQRDPRVQLLKAENFHQWLELNSYFMKELSLPDDLGREAKEKNFKSQAEANLWWGLFEDGKLVTVTALSSNGEKIGQVGGVFTPKEHRQQGFAKATMFHMLKDCMDLHGHNKSVLFTGELNVPAQRLYESMGYNRVGDFALILG